LKAKQLLTQESINLVASKVCCSKNCVQPFLREKIKVLREHMYRNTTFKFRSFMKTDVHQSIFTDINGRKMVVVEKISVCMRAWMLISGVPESTFYCYLKYANAKREARDHGNSGL